MEEWRYATVLAMRHFAQEEDHETVFKLGVETFYELAKVNSPFIKRELAHIFTFLVTQNKRENELMGPNALKFVAKMVNTRVWLHLQKLHELLCKFLLVVMNRHPHLSIELLAAIEDTSSFVAIPPTKDLAWLELFARTLSCVTKCESKDNSKLVAMLDSMITMHDKTASPQIHASLIKFLSSWDKRDLLGMLAIPSDAALKLVLGACRSHDHLSKYYALVCLANVASREDLAPLLAKKGFNIFAEVVSQVLLSEVTERWQVTTANNFLVSSSLSHHQVVQTYQQEEDLNVQICVQLIDTLDTILKSGLSFFFFLSWHNFTLKKTKTTR